MEDKEIKKIYGECRFTILPLREAIQPSGQSVTLQSISCGTPVLITKTKGFWDEDKYIKARAARWYAMSRVRQAYDL